MSTEYHDLKSLRAEIHTCNGGEPCLRCDVELEPRGDALGGSTDLEGALVKILFTPKPTLVRNVYCSRCDAKMKVNAELDILHLCECGGKMF